MTYLGRALLVTALAGVVASPASAQVGGLVRKAREKSAAVIPALEPGIYNDILIELRADVLRRVIAGRQAGRAFATSAGGPAAIRSRYELAVRRVDDLRQQVTALEHEAERLRNDIARAEAEVERLEEATSGLSRRQLAVACQRILIYLSRLGTNTVQTGFSAPELEALGRHHRDLEPLCS